MIILGGLVVVGSFAAATLAINALWPPAAPPQSQVALAPVPPLQPLTGASTVLAPTAISLAAISQALDARAPKNLSGTPQNPLSKLLSDAQFKFTVARGPLSVAGQAGALVVTTPLTGTFEALGTLTGAAGSGASAVGGALGNLLGGNVGQQVENLAGKAFDQHTNIQGTVTTTARPSIAANWRLAPNLAAQVNVVDVVLPIGGLKLSVGNAVKPVLDKLVHDQTDTLEAYLRNDPFIETAARTEWAKLCRAIPLGAGQSMPDLFLEIRPVRAIAAQPKIDGKAVTLLVGVQAQTRIVPNDTKPSCAFPQQLDIVPQANEGTVSIAVPIDIPFTEVSRLLEAQVAGKTFPEDGSGSFAITIKHASIAASGDRLLISLLVNVKKRGLFSFFGADAAVNVWGRPVLDTQNQILRFTDVALDVQSNAAFGLLGAAAQAAAPLLQKTLADEAVIDLKPLAADAKTRIGTAVGALAAQSPGLSANVTVNDLQLAGIAYDDKTLRVIANAYGAVNVAISSLAWQ
jgi:Domain of unknown function (DUF4403)